MSDIYFYFYLFFSQTLKSCILLDTDQYRSNSVNRLDLVADYKCMSRDELRSKFSYVPIWGRRCRGFENAKFASFLVNRQESKSCITYPKINPPSPLGTVIWSFTSFFTSKKCCSSPIAPPNQTRTLKLGVYRVFCFILPSVIPVIGQLMKLTCIMFSTAKKSKGLRYTIFKIYFSPEPSVHFKNSRKKINDDESLMFVLKHSTYSRVCVV